MSQPASQVQAVATDSTSLDVRIASACSGSVDDTTPRAILKRLSAAAPELDLSYAVARSGWHRQGGIVNGDYERIAVNIGDWAEHELDGDLGAILDRAAEIRGFVTRLEGVSHYLIAATGEAPEDFIQIEVEQIQEVIDRSLWDPDWMPDDVQDFMDPLDFPRLPPEPIGPPRLLFRRLVRVPELIASGDAGAKVQRFLNDWGRSSANDSARFCDHWVLSIREYRDVYGDGRLSAKPIAVGGESTGDETERLDGEINARGSTLANLIHAFDRHRGYHFAWYFHMLTQRSVSHQLADAVHADQMGAFDYLPAKDLIVLRDWYDAPYSV